MKMFIPVALLALTAGTLQAEKLDMRFGVIGGITLPQGDLKGKARWGVNKTMGYHIGGFVGIPLNANNEIRPNLTYHVLNGSDWVTDFYSHPTNGGNSEFGPWSDFIKKDFKILEIGADWLYYTDKVDNGLYILGGLAFASIKNNTYLDNTYNSYHERVSVYSTSASQSKVGFKGGVGFSFNPNFSIEGSYHYTPVDDGKTEGANPYDGIKEGYDWNKGFGFSKATWINISAILRFGGGK